MKPGDTASGTVDITNTGSLAGDFALKTANTTGYAALLAQMDLVVLDCGAWTVAAPAARPAPPPSTPARSAR